MTKTPWGGSQIAKLKKKYFPNDLNEIPEHIGESREGCADLLLIKLIDAIEPLSIQVHPINSNALLEAHESGKPEAWFVYELNNPSPLYLGFKENFSKAEILESLNSADPTKCLHSFIPKPYDYISVPAGCVHAIGAGIFIAEPQCIIPNKEGKTWRIFDWNRSYNSTGQKDENGILRELHLTEALTAIDWNLPRGKDLERVFVKNLKHQERFLGNESNPFCLELFTDECEVEFKPLAYGEFSIIIVLDGQVSFSNDDEKFVFHGGESGFIPNYPHQYKIKIQKKFEHEPCVLIFALQQNFLKEIL